MVLRKLVKDESGTIDLVETYSDEGYKLLQEETNVVYGRSVIDVIAGYDGDGIPYSRYHYTETDEKEEEPLEGTT